MEKIDFNKFLPYLVGIVIFLIITMVYFKPALEGKRLRQSDIAHHKGMSKEVVDYRNATGEEALWTNGAFGGMPAYHVSTLYKGNWLKKLNKVILFLPAPMHMVFLYMLGFFILMLAMRVDPWLAIVGSVAFAFSTYFFVILEAGHNTKANAIGYMAPTLAGVLLTFDRKYLLGGAVTALFLGLELAANHIQITYYLGLALLIVGGFKAVELFKEHGFKPVLVAGGTLLAAAMLALAVNAGSLWTTYEYGQYTIRGKSELTITDKANQTDGLDKSYVTEYSYGIGETWTLLNPNFKGSKTALLMSHPKIEDINDPLTKQVAGSYWQYHGEQPILSGPVYVGAIICFLFLLGLLITKGWFRWALLSVMLLSIMLAWGKNFMGLTNFFLDFIPGYNKFRAVSMTLVLAQLVMPILAIMAVDQFIKERENFKKLQKPLLIALGVTGGICLLMAIAPTMFTDFSNEVRDPSSMQQLMQQGATEIQAQTGLAEAYKVREAMFTGAAWRSLLFVLLAGGALFLFGKAKSMPALLLGGIMLILVLVDMAMVNKRYVHNEKDQRNQYELWETKQQKATPFAPSQADQQILADKDPNYRVMNMARRFDQDSETSYFHKSLGGYHGAKLKRYQELISFQLSKDYQTLATALQNNPTEQSVNQALSQMRAVNMLNTKYIIYNPEAPPLPNTMALGNAWSVSHVQWVPNADEEIQAISTINPGNTVVVDERYRETLGNFTLSDAAAAITLTDYKPNHLVYDYSSENEQMLVFSEIFYEKGWNAYVDGELVPHVRCNYVLRAMKAPAGEHTIEYKFEPKSYIVGERISLASSLLLFLAVAGSIFMGLRKKKEE